MRKPSANPRQTLKDVHHPKGTGGRTPQCTVPGKTIQRLRSECGLTQKELATAINKARVRANAKARHVADWEHERQRPTDLRLEGLVLAFDKYEVTGEELLNAGFSRPLLRQVGILHAGGTAHTAPWEKISAEDLPGKWLQELQPEGTITFWATNYLKPGFFGRDVALFGFLEQKKKMEDAAGINKVFIADDERELGDLFKEMKKQADADLYVKWMLRRWISPENSLGAKYSNAYVNLDFKTLDFQIFDSERVLFWVLDDGREPIEGRRLSGSKNKCDIFVKLYRAFFKDAEKFKRDEGPSQFMAALERRRKEGKVW